MSFPSTPDLKLPSVSSTTSEQTANDTNTVSKNPEISIVLLPNGKTSRWKLLSQTFWTHVGKWTCQKKIRFNESALAHFDWLETSTCYASHWWKYWCQVTGLCKNWEFLLSDKADKAERFRYHPVKRRTRYFSRNCKMTFSLVVVVVTSKFREWYKSIKRSRFMKICPFSHLVVYRK